MPDSLVTPFSAGVANAPVATASAPVSSVQPIIPPSEKIAEKFPPLPPAAPADALTSTAPLPDGQLSPADMPPTPDGTLGENILKDSSAEELVKTAQDNPKVFDPISAYQSLPFTDKTPELEKKMADVYMELWKSGTVGTAATALAKNLLQLPGQVLNRLYTHGKNLPGMLLAAGGAEPSQSTTTGVLAGEGAKTAAETVAGTKSALFGIPKFGADMLSAINRTIFPSKALEHYTPEEKLQAFRDELAIRGKMASFQTGPRENDLASKGFAIDPEKVAMFAATDPAAWAVMGEAFKGITPAAKTATAALIGATPAQVAEAFAPAGEAASRLSQKATGGLISAIGTGAEATATGLQKVAKPVAGVAGGIGGAVAGGHLAGPTGLVLGAVEGAEKGFKYGGKAANVLEKAASAGSGLKEMGQQIAGNSPVTSRWAQFGKDISAAAPGAAGEVAKGFAMDVALQAPAAKTPAEREQLMPFGTTFGALGAGEMLGRRALSGQIVGARDWGSDIRTPSTGNFPALSQAHDAAYASAGRGVQRRVNAIRQYQAGIDPNSEFFNVPAPKEGETDALPDILSGMGLPPDWASHGGVTPTDPVRGADGNLHRIIITRDVDSAPHEATHQMDNVVGADATQNLNAAAKQQFGPIWDSVAGHYAASLLTDSVNALTANGVVNPADALKILHLSDNPTPQEIILTLSGKGNQFAQEKIAHDAGTMFDESGITPTDEQLAGETGPRLARAQADADASEVPLWKQVLTPEEQNFAHDQYVGNEIRAEHGDAWFKAGQDENTLGGKMWRAAANIADFLGTNPIAGRVSESQGLPLQFKTLRGVAGESAGVIPPKVQPSKLPRVLAPPGSPQAAEQQKERDQQIVQTAPDVKLPGQVKSQRELLGALNEAKIAGAPVDIQYGHAGGTGPAAGALDEPPPAIMGAVNRGDRREFIQAWRSMPIDTRTFFGTLFSPENFNLTKSGKYQVYGGSHAVLAANAQKLATFASEHPDFALPTGLQIDPNTKSFTPDSWKYLFDRVQDYSRNQLSGRTGAGGALVVPKMKGYFAPPVTGESTPIPQDIADVINGLYGQKTPETARITKKDIVPLNIAGQRIAEATQPGRVATPTAESPVFGEGTAEAQQRAKGLGISGQHVLEPNPFLSRLNNYSDAPSFIEARQKLNLEHMADVNPAPAGAPMLRGNTLTMAAGFAPRTPIEIEGPDGKKYQANFDGYQDMRILGRGFVPQITPTEDIPGVTKAKSTTYGPSLEKAGYKLPAFPEPLIGGQFSPATKTDQEHVTSAVVRDRDTGKVYSGLIHSLAYQNAMAESGLSQKDVYSPDLGYGKRFDEGFSTNRRPYVDRATAAEVADKAGQLTRGANADVGPNGERQLDAYDISGAQFQPKTFIVRHGSTEMNNADPDKDLIRGHIDVPLDEQGRQEAESTADQIAAAGGVNHIITSDLQRTKETADAIADKNPGATVESDPGLRPWKFGPTIEGHPTSKMIPKIAELTENPDTRPPGGETFNEFKDRFLDAFHNAQSKYPDRDTAIVTHYRGTKLLDAWRATGTDNDTIDKAVFEAYDKDKKPGTVDVVDKQGAQFMHSLEGIRKMNADEIARRERQAETETTRNSSYAGNPDQGLVLYSARQRSTMFVSPGAGSEKFLKDWNASANQESKNQLVESYFAPQGEAGAQFATKRKSKQDFELKEGGPGMFVKGWILPDGKLAQFGEKLHHTWLNENPDIAKQYGLKVGGGPSDDITVRNRALQKGFARVNYQKNTGTLMVEAREKDWPNLIPSVKELARANMGKIDNMDVNLFDANVKGVTARDGVALHTYDADEKMDHLPLISEPTSEVTETSPQATPKPETAQFAPTSSDDPDALWHGTPSGDLSRAPYGIHVGTFNAAKEALEARIGTPVSGTWDGSRRYGDTLLRGTQAFQEAGEGPTGYSVDAGAENHYPTGKAVYTTGEPVSLDSYPNILPVKIVGPMTGNIFNPRTDIGANSTMRRGLAAGKAQKGIYYRNEAEDEGSVSAVVPRLSHLKSLSNPAAFSPKESDFKSEETLPTALRSPNWAIITATQEARGKGTDEVNDISNDNLEKALISDGYKPIAVAGNYKGIDQGKNFLVPGMTPQEALRWGKQYGQESVLLNKGLLYHDNTISPVNHENSIIGPEAKKLDFYSQIEGGPAFSMGIDFGKRIPFGKPVQQELGGGEIKPVLSSHELGQMGSPELREHYPEAIVPNRVRNKAGELADPEIDSDIVNAPAWKGLPAEEAITKAADKLVEEHNKWKDHPIYQAGLKWYSEFTPKLKEVFGKYSQLMAELLAATSPNTTPDINFAFAHDALEGYKSGRFTKQIQKFEEGLAKIKDGSWESWMKRTKSEGSTKESFLKAWSDKNKLAPTQSNGKRYGMHSDAVLQVVARRWLTDARGPKTLNFVKNLLGTGHEATIDVWADRTMRRAGYEGEADRWRILPQNATGVSDADFAFSQKAFREAADKIGVQPDALQGGLWFAEKQHWANNGWGRLDLGDFRKEIEKVPMLKSGVEQRLAATKARAKTKAQETPELGLIEARPMR